MDPGLGVGLAWRALGMSVENQKPKAITGKAINKAKANRLKNDHKHFAEVQRVRVNCGTWKFSSHWKLAG